MIRFNQLSVSERRIYASRRVDQKWAEPLRIPANPEGWQVVETSVPHDYMACKVPGCRKCKVWEIYAEDSLSQMDTVNGKVTL